MNSEIVYFSSYEHYNSISTYFTTRVNENVNINYWNVDMRCSLSIYLSNMRDGKSAIFPIVSLIVDLNFHINDHSLCVEHLSIFINYELNIQIVLFSAPYDPLLHRRNFLA